MYTGTLIRDLMITVERAEHKIRAGQLSDERELRVLCEMQVAQIQDQAIFVGAA